MTFKRVFVSVPEYGSGWGVLDLKDFRLSKIRFTDVNFDSKRFNKVIGK